ncbi:MAG TPA: glycine cleavage T C-terminal barrel domain-containing protein, partial [Candidatus Eisenbacteria bacterium]|nr:glycine cleavage T C-terminal barrel domain-containing protein [Candidatus Eisenbacteria bacterium]
KADFIGAESLRRSKELGVSRRLQGLVLEEDKIARAGAEVTRDGKPVGKVTSGSMGISMGRPIGMAYLAREVSAPGETVDVVTRGHAVRARVTARPMYRHGSVRSPKPRRPE